MIVVFSWFIGQTIVSYDSMVYPNNYFMILCKLRGVALSMQLRRQWPMIGVVYMKSVSDYTARVLTSFL